MCQPAKFSMTAGKLCSFPHPLHKNTQPTTMRANSGASQSMCRETRAGQANNHWYIVFIQFLELSPTVSARPTRRARLLQSTA